MIGIVRNENGLRYAFWQHINPILPLNLYGLSPILSFLSSGCAILPVSHSILIRYRLPHCTGWYVRSNTCTWCDHPPIRIPSCGLVRWSDLAFECADLVEHINARVLSDTAWSEVVGQILPPGSQIHQRFRAAQRTCALLWLCLFWSQRTLRLPALLAQIKRVQHLQHES